MPNNTFPYTLHDIFTGLLFVISVYMWGISLGYVIPSIFGYPVVNELILVIVLTFFIYFNPIGMYIILFVGQVIFLTAIVFWAFGLQIAGWVTTDQFLNNFLAIF